MRPAGGQRRPVAAGVWAGCVQLAAAGSCVVLARDREREPTRCRIRRQREAQGPTADLAVLRVAGGTVPGIDQGDEAGPATGALDGLLGEHFSRPARR